MTLYLLSQIFATLSFAWGVYGFWHPADRNFRTAFAISSVLMAAHYALLGAWVGVAICFVAAGRYWVANKMTHARESLLWMTFFIVLGMVCGHFTYLGPQSALPVLANIMATYAVFQLKGPQLRCVMLMVSACWIAYNVYHQSVMGIAQELFYSSLNIYTIYRVTRAHKALPPVTAHSVPMAAHGGVGLFDRRKQPRE
ncbi:MAG: YgjV family protein [Blastochloris viridis]|uniref:YgjV family protein n=1 Tax=Blastochloris viridis TaxID=1079 RepID=A0A6N4RCM1_BLAVI|nr:MAG: YgjV family protein [Blastochloris viridis]